VASIGATSCSGDYSAPTHRFANCAGKNPYQEFLMARAKACLRLGAFLRRADDALSNSKDENPALPDFKPKPRLPPIAGSIFPAHACRRAPFRSRAETVASKTGSTREI